MYSKMLCFSIKSWYHFYWKVGIITFQLTIKVILGVLLPRPEVEMQNWVFITIILNESLYFIGEDKIIKQLNKSNNFFYLND